MRQSSCESLCLVGAWMHAFVDGIVVPSVFVRGHIGALMAQGFMHVVQFPEP